MGDERTPPSWWSTLPGMITALAGFLTAVGGLIVVLHTAGLLPYPKSTTNEDVPTRESVPDTGTKKATRTPVNDPARWMVQETPAPQFGYTHAARFGDFVLDYQSHTGAAEVQRVDNTGHTSIIKTYTSGFATGWTHLVSTPNGILFYKSSNGEGALGHIDESGDFRTVQIYGAGSFIRNCTSVVGTPNGVLFYNKANGDARIDRIGESGNRTTLSTYPAGSAGSFVKGWSSIVYNEDGIIYRDDAGNQAIGEIESDGTHKTIM